MPVAHCVVLSMMLWAPSAHALQMVRQWLRHRLRVVPHRLANAGAAPLSTLANQFAASRTATSATEAAAASKPGADVLEPSSAAATAAPVGSRAGLRRDLAEQRLRQKPRPYGLRQVPRRQRCDNVRNVGCHQPGALGASQIRSRPLRRERRAASISSPCFSGLTDPCSRASKRICPSISTALASTTTATARATTPS